MRRSGTFAAGFAVLLSGLLVATTASAASGFTSKRYGYEFTPEKGFYARLATQPWRGTFPFGDDPGVDEFVDWHERKFIISALDVPASTTLTKWSAGHVSRMQSFCHKAHAFRDSTLGGGPAREFTVACPDYDVIVLTTIHGHRGYIFQFVSPTANSPAADRHSYEAGRRTFHFAG